MAFEDFRVGGRRYLFLENDPIPFVETDLLDGMRGEREVSGAFVAPMPGRITKVAVSPGDPVRAGDLLMVLEAMKMEHSVTTPVDGTVAEIFFGIGDQVEGGAELVRLETAPIFSSKGSA